MSELMDEAVIRMPFDMAMESELSRKQFYDRANSALSELIELRAYKEAAESQKPVGKAKIVGGYPDESEFVVEWLVKYKNLKQGDLLYTKPVPADNPERITEQDAREIAESCLAYWLYKHPMEFHVGDWLSTRGRELLNKLNADREQVLDDTSAQRLWDYYQTLLKHYGFEGITDLLSKYHKLVEQVPAVAVPDGWRESLTEMVQAMRQYEMDVDGQAPEKHRAMMDRAETLLAAPSHSQQSAVVVPDGFREIVESVAHIGVDFGYGSFVLSREHIQRARELLAAAPSHSQQSAPEPSKPLPYWPPCNPGCDPEFNGERSAWCADHCKPARDAMNADRCPSHESEQQNKQSIWSGGRVGNAE